MSYTSLTYLIFLVITCMAYYLMPVRVRWTVLLAANLVFYLFSGWQNLLYLLAAIIISYLCAIKLEQLHTEFQEAKKILDRRQVKQLKKEYKKKRQKVLWVGVGAVLGALAVVKYTNFVLKNVSGLMRVTGFTGDTLTVKLIVPMGVSFFTFQMLSYLIDVYKGAMGAQKNIWRYALYASFFPSIVQGPIPRYRQLGVQLEEAHEFKYKNIRDGAILILLGFAKKIILAERLAVFVNSIYDNYMQYEGVILILATVAYSFQIYADFSSCMDIAAGSARMFDIKLAPNFLRPYFSKTLPEFWRRWHVSLGSWFRDYVFLPVSISKTSLKLNKKVRKLCGERAGKILALALPILAVWSLTGIWHGAEWKYVMWGMFHGIMILLSSIFKPFFQKMNEKLHIRTECFSFRLFQMGRTFFLCCIGRVFFRAANIGAAFEIFRRAVSGLGIHWILNGSLYTYGLNQKNWMVVIAALIVLLLISILEEKKDMLEALNEQNLVFRWIIIYILFFAVIVFGKYGPGYDAAGFIYEQF